VYTVYPTPPCESAFIPLKGTSEEHEGSLGIANGACFGMWEGGGSRRETRRGGEGRGGNLCRARWGNTRGGVGGKYGMAWHDMVAVMMLRSWK